MALGFFSGEKAIQIQAKPVPAFVSNRPDGFHSLYSWHAWCLIFASTTAYWLLLATARHVASEYLQKTPDSAFDSGEPTSSASTVAPREEGKLTQALGRLQELSFRFLSVIYLFSGLRKPFFNNYIS